MRFIGKRLGLLLIVLLVAAVFSWDGTEPTLSWDKPAALGAGTKAELEFADAGRGLRTIEVRVRQGDVDEVLYQQSFPRRWLPWRYGPETDRWQLDSSQLSELSLKEGPAQLVVRVGDQPNLGLFSRELITEEELVYDVSPPRVAALSRQHYIRQGGSEAVLYRVSEPVAGSGVMVGQRQFKGYPVPGQPEGTHIALFALAWDDPPETRIRLWAQDEAGNRSESGFWHRIQQGRFRQRTIEITDSFIEQVAPEIVAQTPELEQQGSAEEMFVAINSRLRVANNERIAEITGESADRLLWEAPFQQLSNSQVESHFADQRSYRYDNRIIDRQTHLGFDLATTAQAPIEAANAGRVAFADYLGIYGNCLLIDHGLGLFSLYGHLSDFEVAVGDIVTRGQLVGRSGQTGLAAGDHLHFSMVLQGVQVNPVEWWDAKWVENHLLSRLVPES